MLPAQLKAAEEELQRKPQQQPPAQQPPSSSSSNSDSAAHMRAEATRLRAKVRYAWQQIAQMKQFLSDYGLVWVGEPDSEGLAEPLAADPPSSSHSGGSSPSSSGGGGVAVEAGAIHPPRPPAQERSGAGAGPRRRGSSMGGGAGGGVGGSEQVPPSSSSQPNSGGGSSNAGPSYSTLPLSTGLPFSIERLTAAVAELNQLAGDGEGQLVGGGGHGAVLHTPEAVRLVLYRDGLQVHRSPPRPYNDPAAWGMLKDVVDGYFPMVLKAEFPNGVPIKVCEEGEGGRLPFTPCYSAAISSS